MQQKKKKPYDGGAGGGSTWGEAMSKMEVKASLYSSKQYK